MIVPTKMMNNNFLTKNGNSGNEMKSKNSRKLKWQIRDIRNASSTQRRSEMTGIIRKDAHTGK